MTRVKKKIHILRTQPQVNVKKKWNLVDKLFEIQVTIHFLMNCNYESRVNVALLSKLKVKLTICYDVMSLR